jgi:hypothetical protein
MRFIIPVLAATLTAQPAMAFAQDDDWEFQQDAGRKLTMAAVRYDDGKAIIARCQDGDLKLVIVGLPEMTGASTYLEAQRADGRRDVQDWRREDEAGRGVMSSGVPSRDIRFLRGGGTWRLSTRAGDQRPMRATLDLPVQSANLDRVLTACQRPLQDDRDALRRADPLYRNAAPPQRRGDEPRRPQAQISGVAEGSCIVRDLRFANCRTDYERPRGAGREGLAMQSGRRLEGEDRDTLEGAVAYIRTVTTRGLRPNP